MTQKAKIQDNVIKCFSWNLDKTQKEQRATDLLKLPTTDSKIQQTPEKMVNNSIKYKLYN